MEIDTCRRIYCRVIDHACGIALPRLPKRSTLQDAGYLDDGPRPTVFKPMLEDAGG
jgi:hypothetical protein